ncbi:MAG: hypothetical protein AAF985_00090 [Bacteroidota bacterium]
MRPYFPILLITCLLIHAPLFAAKGILNEDLSSLFNSLENQLNDVKGEKSTDSGLAKSKANIYETGLSIDGNLAYLIIEDSGIRYHQSLFDSESDRLSLLDDLQSYEGSHSIHQVSRTAGAEIFKVRKGRKTIGFLQFKTAKGQSTLLAFSALNQSDFQSNLELILQSGGNDFAGLKGSFIKESSEGIERFKCNLSFYAASESYFVDVFTGQIYQILGRYVTFPFVALQSHLERISRFGNDFQIVDRGVEDETYKIYLSKNRQDYLVELRRSGSQTLLSISKDRSNTVEAPTAPISDATDEVPVQANTDLAKEEEASQNDEIFQEEPLELPSTAPIEASPPPLESGTFSFPGKGGQTGCYTGTIKNGKRHGQGTFVAKDGTVWEGEWENDVLQGTVILRKNTGDVYEGEIRNYQRHGYGTYRWRNSGNLFEGDWKNDQRDGKAKYTIAKSGRRFEGTYIDNRIHGTGTWFYPDGTTLQGHFNRGTKEGRFTVKAPDGTSQQCTYERGRLISSGRVRLIESYGAVDCDYIKGLRHGPATITYHDGTVEQRNYKYGKLDGVVTCTYPDGAVQELEYKSNQLLSSGHLKIKLDNGFFEGDFKAGVKNGPGIIFYDNEVVEDGSYKAGKREGAFTLVGPSGDVQSLNYKKGILVHTGQVKIFGKEGYYDGPLNQGIKEGNGRFVFYNGNILSGTWSNDQKEGSFTMQFADGQKASQQYTTDKLERSRIIKKPIECNTPPPLTTETTAANATAPQREPLPIDHQSTASDKQNEPQEDGASTREEATPALSPEEEVEQFILNFKSVAKDRGYELARHTKGTNINKYAALAINAFFDRDKEYLYVVVFKDCSDCEVTVGRGKGEDVQYKTPQVKNEGHLTYAVYSFKSLESNTKPIWAFPNLEEKNGEALLFVRE